jgi:hypothetical protein
LENRKRKFVKQSLSISTKADRKRKRNPEKNLFDFWKNRKYNNHKRVASKRKSSLPATRFLFYNFIFAMKKCVACQRKSSLYDRATFFCAEKGGVETKWQKVTR